MLKNSEEYNKLLSQYNLAQKLLGYLDSIGVQFTSPIMQYLQRKYGTHPDCVVNMETAYYNLLSADLLKHQKGTHE